MDMPQWCGGQSISKQQMVCWASYGPTEHTAKSVYLWSQRGCAASEKTQGGNPNVWPGRVDSSTKVRGIIK